MNKYLVYLKNPKIWIGIVLFIVSIISIIALTKALKPIPSPHILCDPGQSKITCPGKSTKCVTPCEFPDMTWKCDSEKCECNDSKGGAKLCGNQCCTSCGTDGKTCCPDEQQYTTTNADGTTTIQCCNAGTKANSARDGCNIICGNGGKTCEDGTKCVEVTNIKPAVFSNIVNSLTADQSLADSDEQTGVINFCAKDINCQFADPSPLPAMQGQAYPYYNFSTIGLADNNGLAGCFPKVSDTNCYNARTESDCNNDNCDWLILLDEYSKNTNVFEDKMKKRIEHHTGQSTLGNYCKNKDEYARYLQYRATLNQDRCSVSDCIHQISNENTIHIVWNEENKTCSALKNPSDSGLKTDTQTIQCTGNRTPCYNCISDQNPVATCDKDPSLWQFTDCNSDEVLYYTGSGTKGNCPWGDNSSKITDYDSTAYHGVQLDAQGPACYNDGQIKYVPIPPPPKLYKYKTLKDGNVESGKICEECTDADTQCFNNCESSCNDGYVLNGTKEPPSNDGPGGKNCIYACQKDGGNPYLREDNGNSSYHFKAEKIDGGDRYFCFRNYPVIDGDRRVCQNSGDDPYYNDDCTQFTQDSDVANYFASQNFTLSGCASYDNNNKDCFAYTRDNINVVSANKDDMKIPPYMYRKDQRSLGGYNPDGHPPISGQIVNCWTDKPDNIFFTYPRGIPDETQSKGDSYHFDLWHPDPVAAKANFCGDVDPNTLRNKLE